MSARAPILRSDAEMQLAAHFNMIRGRKTADMAVREAAFSRFEAVGLPNRRVEAWHYTDLRRLMSEALAPSAPPKTLELVSKSAPRIEFVDGYFVGAVDLPAGMSLKTASIAPAPLGNKDVLVALNTAFAPETLEISVAADADIAAPLHILSKFKRRGAATTRVIIHVGAGARLTVLEEARAESGQINSLVHFDIGDGATVEHVALCGNAGQNIATFSAILGENSVLDSFALVAGGGLTRRQAFVRFDGENSKAGLRGISLLKGQQHADTTLVVEHAAPHCESRELFKHILDSEAKGVFQGKIVVQPHAQKTDGVMKSNTLALSDTASMSNKPELEIFADDVVCGHGATVGQIDEDQMFYLQARGLPRPEAESLLIEAFALGALDFVANEDLRDLLTAKIHTWLHTRHGE